MHPPTLPDVGVYCLPWCLFDFLAILVFAPIASFLLINWLIDCLIDKAWRHVPDWPSWPLHYITIRLLVAKCTHGCRSDEDARYCAHRTCPATAFVCANGRCISPQWRCDHDDDCGDGSDETDCDYPPCGDGQFTCRNFRCIDLSAVCIPLPTFSSTIVPDKELWECRVWALLFVVWRRVIKAEGRNEVCIRLHIFIQLSPTVTKLRHIKCDHPACVSADGGHFEHTMWTGWSRLIRHNFIKVADE